MQKAIVKLIYTAVAASELA